MTLERGYEMTESIQKKLLRVRPPRVKITYDVETGGAIEKKELPFIVGILADLKGDRDAAVPYDALKLRAMTDIDRDNFNDVMNTIQPRVALSVAKRDDQALADLLSGPGNGELTFSNIDDFEPIKVIKSLPALNSLYFSRSQIRTLQSKAEADDAVAHHMDAMVQVKKGDLQSRYLANLAATVKLEGSDGVTMAGKLVTLQNVLATGDDAAKKTELLAWSLLLAITDDAKTALVNGTVLAKALTMPDSIENRTAAKALLESLKGTDAAQAAKAAAFLPAEVKTAIIDPIDVATLDATSIATPVGDPGNDAKWVMPLLLMGLAAGYMNDPTQAQIRQATLGFVKYLTQRDAGAPTPAELKETADDIFPLIQSDTAKTILALSLFMGQVKKRLIGAPDSAGARAIDLAKIKGSTAVMDELVALIDQDLSGALSSIMHCDSFKKIEATWRGLHYLVFNTETSTMLKLRVFNAQKAELLKDMQKAVEFDQSVLFKMVYEAEYGTYGGFPYSLLVGDYAIGSNGDDIDFLTKMSEVAAAAHAPFLAQASQELFQLSGFDKLDKPRDLAKIFEGEELINWRAFREMEDARYVTLALPRALLRLPYGMPEKRNTKMSEGVNFNEAVSVNSVAQDGEQIRYGTPNPDHFLWGNPAYLLAERITNAFSLYNWTAAIRGVEGGGLVEGLPTYTYSGDKGGTELFCPTEVSITDRREKELNDLGFISLCHCKGTGKAAFFGGQTTNLPKKYFSDDANANAKISAMLPYMLAASRFAHYIKVIMREKIGSFLTRANVESYLNTWISNYVLLDDNATQEVKSAYPLRSAKVVVTEVPGEPGAYRATVFLKPHFQLEELTTSIRLVANLPK
jgi:type VI secretion system protein ImpC